MTDDLRPFVPRDVTDPAARAPNDPFGSHGMPNVRVFTLGSRSPLAVWAFAIGALAVGGVLFVLGLTLILGLVAAGAVIGTGLMVFRRLTGGARRDEERLADMMRQSRDRGLGLDPTMEVLSPQSGKRADGPGLPLDRGPRTELPDE